MNEEVVYKIKELDPEMIPPSTENMKEELQGGCKMVVIGKPGCFGKGTRILMYDGSIKNVEDVKVGDIVMGDDSTPRNVMELCRNIDKMYKISPKIGDEIRVNSKHILTLIKTTSKAKGQIVDIVLEDFLNIHTKTRNTFNWIRVPVLFEKKEQKVDPYVSGFFLDGDFSFIKREFIKRHFKLSDTDIDVVIDHTSPKIPDNILKSSIEDRSKFLAGLLDSRGKYNSTTKRFDISLNSEELCNQVMFLSGSIGYYTSRIKNVQSNFFTQSQQYVWNCYIYVNTNCILQSKIFDISYIKTLFGDMFTTDFSIIEDGVDQYYGFTINGNHRFLLADFSVVHNTGKCQGKNTPVIMYDGKIKMVQDVKVGDKLMGDDSTPRNVLSICKGNDEMYKINQSNGMSYTVNSAHILSLNNGKQVVDISINDYINMSKVEANNLKGYRVCIEWPEKPLKKHPFKYGLRIGNSKKDTSISKRYIINSKENRILLLKGLLTSIYNKQTGGLVFKQYGKKLFKSFVFLINSLGYNVDENTFTIQNKVSDINVVSIGMGKYYGFELDGNHRYLLGDFTVTHNTSTLTSLLYEKRHIFPIGMVFSGTEDSNGHWGKHFPSTFIYNRLELEKVEDFIKRQKFAKKHLENPWGLLLLDDCADEPKLINNHLFGSIFKNGRHWKMWFVLSLQYAADIRPVLRSNIDFTFIMRETNMRNRRIIWENYAGVIDDFKTFCELMDEITNDYTALVINNTVQSNRVEDCVFWYKGKKVPDDFKFGSRDFWDYHYVRYNNKYKDPTIY